MRTSFPVDAPSAAWAALGDPDALVAALPGCRSVTAAHDGDGTLHVVADLSVASVRGLWAGTVRRVDADSVRIDGSGEPGTIELVVRADPSRSALTVEGTVDGPLATVGSAVLAAAIRRLAEAVLAAATAPTPTRGDGFRSGQPEVMGSGSGTHDLRPGPTEPTTSAGRTRQRVPRQIVGPVVAAAGAVVVVALGRRRRIRRAR